MLGAGPLPPENHDAMEVSDPTTLKYEWRNSRDTNVGLVALLLNVFSFGIHAGRSQQSMFSCKSEGMTTVTFRPSAEYVSNSVMQPAVKEHLKKHRPSLYMIVGVRVCHGATVTYAWNEGTQGDLDVGPVGLEALGIPVDFNASITRKKNEDGSQSLTINQDFVVAYRLRKCRYSRPAYLTNKFYTRNATMHDLNSPSPSSGAFVKEDNNYTEDDASSDIIIPEGIAQIDLDEKALKLKKEWLLQSSDDGGCTCVMLGLRNAK